MLPISYYVAFINSIERSITYFDYFVKYNGFLRVVKGLEHFLARNQCVWS